MVRNVYGFSFKDDYSSFSLPRYFTIGISNRRNDLTLSLDSEYIFGTFSGLEKKEVEIWFLRAGLEKGIASWAKGRIGLIYPAIARTSTVGDITDDLPCPVGGSVGVGLRYKSFNIDLSVYGDPAKSYVAQEPVIAYAISLTLEF